MLESNSRNPDILLAGALICPLSHVLLGLVFSCLNFVMLAVLGLFVLTSSWEYHHLTRAHS